MSADGTPCAPESVGPEDDGAPVTVDYDSHPLEASQQVLRRPGVPVTLDMAPRPPENSLRVLRRLWAPVSIHAAPYVPKPSACPEEDGGPVSVDLAPHFLQASP